MSAHRKICSVASDLAGIVGIRCWQRQRDAAQEATMLHAPRKSDSPLSAPGVAGAGDAAGEPSRRPFRSKILPVVLAAALGLAGAGLIAFRDIARAQPTPDATGNGFFNPNGSLKSIGIQCALCHSTVDNSVAFGIGQRLDGWANRDLDVGKIVASAPNLAPFATLLGVDVTTVKAVLQSWGPGKFDAELSLDGKAFNP
jgi:hypothetical protein